jgi:tight adherence protein B
VTAAASVVRVQAHVSGLPGVATASYRTPAIVPAAPYHRSWLDRFFLSGGSAVLVALVAGGLIMLVGLTILRGRAVPFRRRIGEFVPIHDAEVHEQATARLAKALERVLAGRSWWDRFVEEVEIAKLPIPAAMFALLTLAATVLLILIAAAALPPVLVVFAIVIPPLVAHSVVKARLREQRGQFGDQLPDNMTVLAAALRVGHSFVGALSVMIEEAEEPARSEFRRAMTDEQLGVPVEESLIRVAERMDNPDLEQVALVASLQRQTGGNTAEVLDTVVATIRERADVRRLVKTLTTQGRAARWVLTALPVALLLLLSLINPDYVYPLYHSTAGQALLAIAIVMIVTGGMLIGRIVDIKV